MKLGRFSTEFKVGLFVILSLIAILYFSVRTSELPIGHLKKTGWILKAEFDSATGVMIGTGVEMAGVKIGHVRKIGLTPEGKALLTMEIDRGIDIPEDSVFKITSKGILGDRIVTVSPGRSTRMLKPGMNAGSFYAQKDIDKVMTELDELSKNINDVISKLKGYVDEGGIGDSVKNIINNVYKFTEEMGRASKLTTEGIEDLTENLLHATAYLKEIMKEGRDTLGQDMKKVESALDELQSAIENIKSISEKVNSREGTIGKLINDTETIERINSGIERVNKTMDEVGTIIDKYSRLRTLISYRGEVYFSPTNPDFNGTIKNIAGITLKIRDDYYYIGEFVDDPLGDSTWSEVYIPEYDLSYTEYRINERFQFSFQFAKRLGNFTLRAGIKESTGGVGVDYSLLKDRLLFSSDFYDFGVYEYPNLKLLVKYDFSKNIFLCAGSDNLINGLRENTTNFFIGAGFSFYDEDLKTILPFIPAADM